MGKLKHVSEGGERKEWVLANMAETIKAVIANEMAH
jgi:hypothetical protein